MKLQDIKTREQFLAFLELWENRAAKIMFIWNDQNRTIQARSKAFCLYVLCREYFNNALLKIKTTEFKEAAYYSKVSDFGFINKELTARFANDLRNIKDNQKCGNAISDKLIIKTDYSQVDWLVSGKWKTENK